MTFGSLFAGIGGLDLGLERAGMECLWQVEKNPFCLDILRHHWPDVPKYDDVHGVGGHLSTVDLICGGFPCQPVSQIGKQEVQEDERWLWPEFSRIIRTLRPTYVLVENVPGLLVRGLGDVLRDLAQSGYDAEWDCLPAGAFGARHQRVRTFLVAYSVGRRPQGRDGPSTRGWEPILGAKTSLESPVRWDLSESPVCRGTNGVPFRVDRLKALGNAVVPQIPELIGRAIMEVENES